MPKSTRNMFIEKARLVHGDKYDYSKVDYKNNYTKVKIICPIHGEFEQTPHSHSSKCGCPKCSLLLTTKHSLKTINKFIDEARLVHGDKYDYSKVDYINGKTNIIIICPIHGEFEQTPKNHLKKCGCPKCSRKSTYNDFVLKARLVHGDKYDYSKVDYVDSTTKVIIICPIHGEFEQTPVNHVRGFGCSKCSYDSMRSNDFIDRSRLVHGDKYDYSKVDYVGSTTKVKIICPIHGEFEQTPANHLAGTSCSYCAHGKLTQDDFIRKSSIIHDNKYSYNKLIHKTVNDTVIITCPVHGDFKQKSRNHLEGYGCRKCSISVSKYEKEMSEFIKLIYDNEIVESDRKVIRPYELDIFMPDKNLAIEFDGLYWHSYDRRESKDEKLKHQNKHGLCVDKNIKLLQIWENEWNDKRNIVKSMIRNSLGKSERIYARKCTISDISSQDFDEFMINNHLQGSISSRHRIGLFYDGQLVQVIGFNGHNKYDYEITRIASILNKTVVGGVSKLFKHFLNEYNPKTVLTFANARYSTGNVYKALGFKNHGLTSPGYYYVKSSKVFHRVHFQKHKLENKLEVYDPNKTEVENMFDNQYRRLWDSGNYKYVFENNIKQQSCR